jgi:sugar phosphate isomerase/epimerase
MHDMHHWTRRAFIEAAVAAGAGCWVAPRLASGAEAQPAFGAMRTIDDAGTLQAAGYDFIEGSVSAVLVPDKPEAVFAPILARVKALPLPLVVCNSFIPGTLKLVGPDARHDEAAAYAETAFRRARAAGLDTIVFGSGTARTIPDGFNPAQARDQFITFVTRLAPIAQREGVRMAIEPLQRRETNLINSLAEGAAVVDEVNHPAVRLQADVYHMMQEREGPEAITAAGSRIIHVHVAQVGTRMAPLPGGTDFRPYFAALKGITYLRRISIESNWPEHDVVYANALAYLKEQWAGA